MSVPLRVLVVEDSEEDAELLIFELERSGYELSFKRVDTAAAMKVALDEQLWDIVIADYTMPSFSAPDALTLLKEKGLDLPFIIVSGNIGEDIAVAAMKAGAHDYLMKGNLARLAPAVERELREAVERTKRRAAEQALRQQEERFRLLIENALDIIMVLRGDGTIDYKSPSLLRVLGYTPDDLLGKIFFDYIHPDDVAQVRNIFANTIHNPGVTLSIEFRFQHQDGSWRVLEAVGKYLLDYSQAARMVVNSRDITERKQAEEIRNTLEKEREVSERKFEFVSMMAHEFRNPLSAILMSAELLENYQDKATEEQKSVYFRHLQSSAQQMRQLLDDVLIVSRAEIGSLECYPISFDLNQFCHDLVEEIQLTLDDQHTLNFVNEGKCGMVYLDDKLLWHILTNLLSNAIKYSPKGGTIHFHLSCRQGEARFQIQDQGIGIPLEDCRNLFELFYRASNVDHISGTGLGLAIVKKFVDVQGGRIDVSSQVGVGATFTVTLPLQSPS